MRSYESISVARACEWLEGLGYRVQFREQGWTECLVWLADERWLGRGGSRDEALQDALSQMLPSRAARLAIPTSAFDPLAKETQAGYGGEASAAQAGPFVYGTDEAELLPSVGGNAPPDDVPQSRHEQEDPQARTVKQELRSASETDRGKITVPQEPVLSVEDALRALEPLEDRIAAERAELGLATPERQRLAILGWICHARAVEEASDHAPKVEERVHKIALGLASLCKVHWPGSVVALQLHKTPEDTLQDLPVDWKSVPSRTWLEAAGAAEEALQQVETRDAQAGRDEYGWADASALDPAPLDATSEMNSLRVAVERLTGRVDHPVAKKIADRMDDLSAQDVELAVEWGRLLRWLRGVVTDFDSWSMVAGRLRWLSKEIEKRDATLRQTLDAGFCPKLPWAKLLGRDPEEKRRRRARLELYRRLGDLRQHPSDDGVQAWLRDALELVENGVLPLALLPFREAVLAISVNEFLPGAKLRTARRRLTAVQKELRELPGGTALPQDIEEEIRVALLAPVEPEAPMIDASKLLFQSVRPLTEGKHAAFVGNRADPRLQDVLRRELGFADIDWCEGSQRRVDAMIGKIGAGAFDIVLGATGFQSHTVDGKLYLACRNAGVSYVRVNKGRPVACAASIIRAVHGPSPQPPTP